MSRLRMKLRDESRIQKKYPLVKHVPVMRLVSDNIVEIENLLLDINEETEVIGTFTVPFSGIPAIAATLLTENSNVGSVNVYAYDITTTTVTIKTSAPITGKISVQAIYISP